MSPKEKEEALLDDYRLIKSLGESGIKAEKGTEEQDWKDKIDVIAKGVFTPNDTIYIDAKNKGGDQEGCVSIELLNYLTSLKKATFGSLFIGKSTHYAFKVQDKWLIVSKELIQDIVAERMCRSIKAYGKIMAKLAVPFKESKPGDYSSRRWMGKPDLIVRVPIKIMLSRGEKNKDYISIPYVELTDEEKTKNSNGLG